MLEPLLRSRRCHARYATGSVVTASLGTKSSTTLDSKLFVLKKSSGCDAVHPGYGFLSERAEFAKAVVEAGLTWIGPPASAIAAMGDKTAARRKMRDTGVPVVPGTVEPVRTPADASKAARTIGYPLLLKAAAGGGGRGMRVVRSESELEGAFSAARASFATLDVRFTSSDCVRYRWAVAGS